MTDLDAIRAPQRYGMAYNDTDEPRPMADGGFVTYEDYAVVLTALDKANDALSRRVTNEEELQRRMDAVRPLVAERDAAIEREARLRAALPDYIATAIGSLKDGGGVTWNEARAMGLRCVALATTPEATDAD